MHRIDRVLLALKPVARYFSKDDLPKSILPIKRLPIGNERRRLRPKIGPNQASQGFEGIGLDVDFVFESCSRCSDIVVRLLDAATGLVESPTVIVTAQAA